MTIKNHKWTKFLTLAALLFILVIGSRATTVSANDRVCHVVISKENLGETSTFLVEGKQVSIKAQSHKNAIQKIFEYAKNLNNIEGSSYDSLEITFKSGQYDLDGTLFIYSNTKVVCEEGTVIRSSWEYGTLLRTATLRHLDNGKVSDEMIKNITVVGGKWDGMNKPGTIFRFTHTSNILIDGVEICNLKDTGHLVALEATKNVTIQNSKFYNHQISSGAKETESSEAIHMDFTRGGTDLSEKEYTDYPCMDIVIQNNEIHDVPTGVGSHTAMNGVTHKNITIKNNHIYNTTGNAVRIYRYRNVVVEGNNIHNAVGAISVNTKGSNVYNPKASTVKESEKDIKGVSINGNKIENISGNAIWLTGNSEYPFNGVKITNNYLNNSGNTAITVRDYCHNTRIENNTLLNSGEYAIQANNHCNRLVIYNNAITTTKKHGIAVRLSSNNSNISNNTLNGVKESGIVVYTKSNNATISNNIINNPGGDGVLLKDSCVTAKISGNKITGAKNCGINIKNKTSKVNVSKNQIVNAKSTGIFVNGSVTNTSVNWNKVTNSGSMGISFIDKCNNAKVQNNTVSGGTYGISIKNNCNKPTVKLNTIANTKKNAIQLLSKCSNGTISQNKISKSKASGIYLKTNCIKNKIEKNNLNTTASHGIALVSGCNETKLLSNTVRNAKGKGIFTKAAKKTVSKKNRLIKCKK